MTTYLTCVPAYGRDYRSKAAVLADYNAGKDFLVQSVGSSGYINNGDHPEGTVLSIRYNRLQSVVLVPKPKAGKVAK